MGTERNAVAAAMGASSFIAVTQILTLERLDWQLRGAIGIFALCIPAFARIWFRIPRPEDQQDKKGHAERTLDVLSICILDFVGFALMFFHFGWLPGTLFLVSSAMALRWVGRKKYAPKTILQLIWSSLRFQMRRAAETFAGSPPEAASKADEKSP
jgi:hypothetical protein